MSDKDSVDARLAEIEQRAKRARYVSLMGGYGETGDARELLSKDVPWLLSQLRDARAENASLVESLDRIAGERDALCKERNDARHLAECTNEARKAATRERNKMGARAASVEAKLAAVREAAVHPWKGPHDTDASMLLDAADRLSGGYPVGGQHTTSTVARTLRAVAALAAAEQDEPALPESMLTGPATFEFDEQEQDEPTRCEHGFTDAHAVIETSFAPPPHPTCPGPVSQPTEGSEQ